MQIARLRDSENAGTSSPGASSSGHASGASATTTNMASNEATPAQTNVSPHPSTSGSQSIPVLPWEQSHNTVARCAFSLDVEVCFSLHSFY